MKLIMQTLNKLILLTALFFLPTLALALSPAYPTEGPVVPCVGCDSLSIAPYPETGVWSNPQKSPGSGLSVEIKNGMLVGYLYSYTDDGKPEWLIISGQLQRSETAGVIWELDTRMTRVEGGYPVEYRPFTPPDQITSDKRIVLEFKQRNYLHIKIYTDGLGLLFDEYFVPFVYGSVSKAYFSAQTPYLLPEFGGNSVFVVSVRPDVSALEADYFSFQMTVSKAEVSGESGNKKVLYQFWPYISYGALITPLPPRVLIAEMVCELDANSQQPGCKIELNGVIYNMPIGNLSNSRFIAEAEDGSIIEGFRLDYD